MNRSGEEEVVSGGEESTAEAARLKRETNKQKVVCRVVERGWQQRKRASASGSPCHAWWVRFRIGRVSVGSERRQQVRSAGAARKPS